MDAQQCWIGKGWTDGSVGLERVGRTVVSDWKGLDAQQCFIGKSGRTAVRPCSLLITSY